MKETVDTDVSLLHVVDEGAEAPGREFLRDWAASHGLTTAELRTEAGGVEEVIGRLVEAYSLVIVGATERGLFSRIVHGSLTFGTIERLESPVHLTERPGVRPLWDRLFGR